MRTWGSLREFALGVLISICAGAFGFGVAVMRQTQVGDDTFAEAVGTGLAAAGTLFVVVFASVTWDWWQGRSDPARSSDDTHAESELLWLGLEHRRDGVVLIAFLLFAPMGVIGGLIAGNAAVVALATLGVVAEGVVAWQWFAKRRRDHGASARR